MIGILLATHGLFCEGIKESVEMVMGDSRKLRAIKLKQEDDVSEFKDALVRNVAELEDGDGVLVLLDVLGGSPYNMAASIIQDHHVECVTGLNLPMLLEALECRESVGLKDLAARCMKAGTEGIIDVRQHLGI